MKTFLSIFINLAAVIAFIVGLIVLALISYPLLKTFSSYWFWGIENFIFLLTLLALHFVVVSMISLCAFFMKSDADKKNKTTYLNVILKISSFAKLYAAFAITFHVLSNYIPVITDPVRLSASIFIGFVTFFLAVYLGILAKRFENVSPNPICH